MEAGGVEGQDFKHKVTKGADEAGKGKRNLVKLLTSFPTFITKVVVGRKLGLFLNEAILKNRV